MESKAAIYLPNLKQIFYYRGIAEGGDMYLENFNKTKRHHFQSVESISFDPFRLDYSNYSSTSKAIYLEYIQKIKNEFKAGRLEKLVASEIQVFENEVEDFHSLFHLLIEKLPQTNVYFFYIENRIWIGASPELIGKYQDTIFSTISLAGTQVDANFTEKDIREQEIVTEFLKDTLDISAKNTVVSALNFGHLQHLLTEINIDVGEEFNFENKIHEIHPSPALSGYPKKESVDFILQNDIMQREIYGGMVSMNLSNLKYSFATIRCAQISQNQIVFYGGGGITPDSNPEKEWIETLNKIEVLKNIILPMSEKMVVN